MERRANGEGTKIRKHSKGGYYKAITLPGGKRKFIYGATKKVVIEKEQKVRKEAEDGITAGPITIDRYLQDWLNDSVKGTVSERTWERYEEICRIHLQPGLGKIALKDLSAPQIQRLYGDKRDAGLSPRTIQYIHRTLFKALKKAVRMGYVVKNVAGDVDPPKVQKKEIHPLSLDQVEILLGSLDNSQDRTLYTLAISTGIRRSEILGLRWKDLDIEERRVEIRRALSRTRDGYVFVTPKSAKGKRSVGLIPRALEAIEDYRRDRGNPGSEALVFSDQDGKPFHPWLVTKPFQSKCRKLGLPEKIRFHDLRHTAATIWLVKGIHPKIVQEALGHSTITITLDTYSHVLPSLQDRAVSAMEEALSDHTVPTTICGELPSP